ncbi:hypothetical protein PTE30175_05499 [Pandoraea terrae]|uniref:Lipoprotein n=1 Tax=Pandoraea terrae TaxID=1537710 RepID=A0A5E4ZFD3_9BURK|nr:hypothetical protein [Pandoraea terrae]VVE59558.1 hypothetical protein PTE30175_05499 [Pandoraea terrae]
MAIIAVMGTALAGLAGCSERGAPPLVLVAPPVPDSTATLQRASANAAAPAEVQARLRPVAAMVNMSHNPTVGEPVTGTYRWMADWPESDSVHGWEAAAGATRIRLVGHAREFVPPASLRGVRVRYCIKPVTGAGEQRLAGYKSCSAWTAVDAARKAPA